MAPQYAYRLFDESNRRQCGLGIALDQEILQALKVIESALGVDQARQDFALGRFDGLPPTRSRRYAWTSSAA